MPGENGGTTDPIIKRYKATAQSRKAGEDGKTKETVIFVVEGPDYKTAWAHAREVTRVGTADLAERTGKDKIVVEAEDGGEFKMRPGAFTVQSLDSLQERGKKKAPITVEDLKKAFAEANGGKDLPKSVRDMIEMLEANGPLSDAVKAAAGEGGEPAHEDASHPDAQASEAA